MLKKTVDFLSNLQMTIVSAFFLLLSFALGALGVDFFIDPAWISVIISGFPLLYLAIWRLIYNEGISKISSALLISIAMLAAVIIGDLFAAGEVAFIMSLGALLEEKTIDRAKRGLEKLISLAPVTGRVINGSEEEIVAQEQIKKGSVIRVLPGERIACDGTVIEGRSAADNSIMTGESLPVDIKPGDEVYCGSINLYGSVDILAKTSWKNSSLHRLIKLIEDAENKQAPMQRTADKFASYLVPLVLLIAIFAYIFTRDIISSVTILVVFCPCSLVLATPTAIMAAIGQATKQGVIIKSGDALEKMANIKVFAFDKTGTLSEGKLSVSDIVSFDKTYTSNDLLGLCASVELRSEHPIAKAVLNHARKNEVDITKSIDFEMQAGGGVAAIIKGKKVICGSEGYILSAGISISEQIDSTLSKARESGKLAVLIAIDEKLAGLISLNDKKRPESKALISELKALNLRLAMLSGDNEKTAKHFASELGISDTRANLLPEDKVKCVQSLEKESGMVCMVGDGINDAPALKTAGVSVAVGAIGKDMAIDAADIALMGGDISKILYLKKLADATLKTIKIGIALSMTINFIAIILSLMKVLNPTTGALVHNAGSVFVVLIAALLYDRRFSPHCHNIDFRSVREKI